MGFVQTWQQLAVCRVLLGLLESGSFFIPREVYRFILTVNYPGFFPDCVFLISCAYHNISVRECSGTHFQTGWYTRYQTQKRLAVFYLTSMVISGFSQIIGCTPLLSLVSQTFHS
jgi:hypothetical protein